MTTRNEISQWFDEGVAQNATHMIIVCDTFDYEDYPIFIKDGNPRERINNLGSMQKLVEVYKLDPALKEQQLSAVKTLNMD